jgi:hypothetical protein
MAMTWLQKYQKSKAPHVELLDKKFGGMQPGEKMLISSPQEIETYIRAIPVGRTVDIPTMRRELARKHGASGACPITTSMFTRIVGELALEAMARGERDVTPFWRVVDPDSPIAQKLSCGPALIRQLRETETA